MNSFKATITKIQTVDNLNIVNFNFCDETLTMMSLDLDSNLKIGSCVSLKVKSTYIAIAKEFSGELSYSNQLQAKILKVDNGELLSSVKLKCGDTTCESITTKDISLKMNLKSDDDVILLIKASELSIGEVLTC